MKKIVLLTGVLAAGLAATPVVANAAAPSSPKLQEVNAEDANDVYGNYDGQIKSRFDDIAYIELLIKDQKFPFTEDNLSFRLNGERVLIENFNTVGWHEKAKAEVAKSISDFRHELHDMQDLLNHLWTTKTPEQFKAAVNEDQNWHGHKVNLSKIMDRDYAQKTLLDRFLELNQDWYIYSYYQQLGKNTWAQYFNYTQTDEYKHVNDTYDVKNESRVEDYSIAFRTFYEAKHADRVKTDPATTFQLRTLCAETGCCVENLGEIQKRYEAYLKAIEDEKKLVAQYHKDREDLLSNGLEGVKAYTTLAEEIANLVDPATIKKAGYPDEDSNEATSRINALKATIDAQAADALEYITTFNAQRGYDAANNKYNWEKDFVGEGKDNLTEPKYLANAKAKLGDLNSKVVEYNNLIAAAQKNLENYITLVDNINAVDDWSRVAGKKHDADGDLGNHSDVAYYESHAFDNEVPAAYQKALDKAKAAYEGFALRELKTSETAEKALADAADKAYKDYSKLVVAANANEEEHDKQHETLDGLKKTYEKYLNEFRGLINNRNEENSIDETPELTDGDVVTELYPVYTDAEKGININNNGNYIHRVTLNSSNTPTLRAKGLFGNGYWGTQQSIANVYEAYVAAKAAYDKANTDIEAAYNAGKSVERKEELNTTFEALKTKNGEFNGALTAAKDNEVAFLEGVKAYNEALDKAHHDLDEYAHHPETFGHWSTQIQDVLDQFPPVRDALVQAYNVEAAARAYVNNTLPGEIAALNQAVAELEQKIKDNQTARDANEAAINAALTDLAALKAKYDTVKFTPEHKTSDELATTLQADFQKAWKDYVANDLQVPALYEDPATESDLHFAQTAVGVDFDADIQAMLSAIKSENSVDFDIHHQATNDYALNLAAVKYLKDVVIPALNDTFDTLVQANVEAHKEQYEAYTALLKETYECATIAGTAIDGISDPGDKHSLAEGVVKGDLEALKAQIDNSYIAGSAKADNDKVAKLNNKYVKDLAYAKANDETFKAAYNEYVTENGKVAKVNGEVVEDWTNGYQYENITSEGKNKYSDTANTNVTSAYTEMSEVEKKYLEDIKNYWVNNVPVWETDAVAPNAAEPYAGTALSVYTEKVTNYNTAVENAQKNDAELTKELNALGAKIELVAYNGDVAKANADANLKKLLEYLENLEPECNAAKYNAVLADMVSDWEKEDLIKATVAWSNNTAISNYKANAAKYNALMAEVNKCATYQAALNVAKDEIEALPVVKNQLAIDGVDQKWDKDRDALINDKTGLQWIQNAIETLEEGIDIAYFYGHNYPTNAQIATDIENLKNKATEENAKYVENEEAFKGTAINRYQDIKDAIATYNDTSTMTPVVAEAYLKGVADKLKNLETLKNNLETEYLAENAVNYAPEFDAELNDLLKGVTDKNGNHIFGLEESKNAAEEIGDEKFGDVNNDNKFNEWDITNTKADAGLVEIILYGLEEEKASYMNGDMDFDGHLTSNDIDLAGNLLWHQSVYGAKKALAADVDFEGSVDLVVAGNTVALALNNNVAVNSMQFDIKTPAGAKFSSVIGTARTEGLQVMAARIGQDTYRILVVSLGSGSVINGNEGNLVSFNVAGEGEVEVFNVIAANGVAHQLNGAAVSLGQTTGIDEVASEGNSEIFGLDGIRQSVMKAGVNIVRGANGAVKKIFK